MSLLTNLQRHKNYFLVERKYSFVEIQRILLSIELSEDSIAASDKNLLTRSRVGMVRESIIRHLLPTVLLSHTCVCFKNHQHNKK